MKRFKWQCLHTTLVFSLLLLFVCAAVVAQGFSHILSFQGRLCEPDGRPVPDGLYPVQFTIYDAEAGGTVLWQESQNVTQTGGVFNVYLGTVTVFPAGLFTAGDRWLALDVSGDPEMATRYRLTPSPWAIYAADAVHAAEADHAKEADKSDTVDGFHASGTPLADQLLTLGLDGLWPLSTIPQGPGSGLNADLLDGLHAFDFWTKADGGPFVELLPAVPQAGAAVKLTGGGSAPTVALRNDGLALRASRTAGEFAAQWREMAPAAVPGPRDSSRMAYDVASDRIILFGGIAGEHQVLGDTWAYDYNANTWINMTPASGPDARAQQAMAYDAESDRVILFGGSVWWSWLDDTWAYDYDTNTWGQMHPAVAPSPRTGHAMAYDAESDRVILFGGHRYPGGPGDSLGDTWAYDFNSDTWTQMSPGSAPSPRCWAGMAYDSESDRMVLFGGVVDWGPDLGDTWAYDFNTNTWTQMNPATAPAPRHAAAMAYDAESDRAVLFGGADNTGSPLGETWAFDYNSDTWTLLGPSAPPSARHAASMAYDAESERAILFGGYSGTGYFGDTWAFQMFPVERVAEFVGSVLIAGDLLVEGEKNAVVPTETFGERKVYCQESTEVWFEHIGRGRLENGVATVDLDPIFLETVTIDSAHPMEVSITPYGWLSSYCVDPGTTGFTVRVEDPAIVGEFGYRVVAKRRGFENAILEPTGRRPEKRAR
jgi:hypothetical protein